MTSSASLKTRKLYLAAAISSVLSLPTYAQEAASATDTVDESKMESIQVTGSRVSRDGYDTPTPVATMTEEDIKNMLERKVNVYLSAEEAVELGIADIII